MLSSLSLGSKDSGTLEERQGSFATSCALVPLLPEYKDGAGFRDVQMALEDKESAGNQIGPMASRKYSLACSSCQAMPGPQILESSLRSGPAG